MKRYLYNDLERHFTAPKVISPFFKGDRRVPRKFKKKWKHILCYDYLDLGQKLSYIQHLTNPDYNRFLIKVICQEYLKEDFIENTVS